MAERYLPVRFLAIAGCALLLSGLGGLGWSTRAFWLPRRAAPEEIPAAAHSLVNRAGTRHLFLPSVYNNGLTETRSIEEALPTPQSGSAEMQTAEAAAGEDPFATYFSTGEKVALRIQAPKGVNDGRIIKIAVRPGDTCEYGSRQSCVSMHLDGRVILLTVHSGLGGEGEAFRSAVEGTGLDLAFFPLGVIQSHLAALEGAPVDLRAGELGRDDLRLAALVRVPPGDLEAYFSNPFDDALYAAAEKSEQLRAVIESGKALLIFEICGWQLPGEPWAQEVTPTTASIYLGVVTAP